MAVDADLLRAALKAPKLFRQLSLHSVLKLDYDKVEVRDKFDLVIRNGMQKLRDKEFQTDINWSAPAHSQEQREMAQDLFKEHIENEYPFVLSCL